MKQPRVSIVIPAYHSSATLDECLTALRGQTLAEFETVLVNSSPETETEELVRGRFPEVVFEQSATRLFPHAARNRGIELSRGELVVFTDPDCRARPDWLQQLVAAHEAGHPVVGGAMELASDRWFERGAHLTKFSWLLAGLPAGPRWICPSANVLYPRTLLDRLGPLEGDLFCGDAVLAWRAAAAGSPIWFEPRAVVEHRHEGDIPSFFRLRLRRGSEFADARMAFEGWSRGRAAGTAALLPCSVALTLLRAGRDAFRGGWGAYYLATLPVQLAGQAGWCAGEAAAQARAAVRGAPSRTRSAA
jgi:GT2 family glycosyltransferase